MTLVPCLWAALPALAQDDPIELMVETAPYTEVADAFDEYDPFDVNLRLGFVWSNDSATVEREVTNVESADGRPSRRFVAVAEHERVSNALELGLEVGVYRDVMLFVGLPVVLSETRELRGPDGVDCDDDPGNVACSRLTTPERDGMRTPLIDLGSPLLSAKRSGLPYIDVGLAWGVTNQQRVERYASWVLRGEVSIPTSGLMEPCVRGAGTCEPGVSNGQGALTFGSRWSYRFRHVEPHTGLAHTFTWISRGDALYRPAGDLDGVADDRPPSRTELSLGAFLIPWEDRGRHQRFGLDTRASAELVSGGRDLSPLFDALGSSSNPHLAAPNVESLAAPRSERQTVPFTGVTRVESHARLSFTSALVIQAARYVRFTLSLGLTHATPHLLTGEPACNTDIDLRSGDPRAGQCVQGLPDPAHRPAIDAPGQRFRLGSELGLRLGATAAGQF